MAQYQSCKFLRKRPPKEVKFKRDVAWERGIAKLNGGFDAHDVAFILDGEGKRVRSIWNYELLTGPGLNYIDTGE